MKRRTVKVLIVLGTVAIVRFVVPIGVAAWHFSSTPTMREWVRERPVEEPIWDAADQPAVREERTVLGVGTPAPGPARFGVWRPTVTFEHGNESLLKLTLEVRFAAEEAEGWRESGVGSEVYGDVSVHVTDFDLDPEFHAVAVFTQEHRAPGGGGGPTTTLDVFLLAGPGVSELVKRWGQDPGYGWSDGAIGVKTIAGKALQGWLLGILHPVGSPPEQGLGYHIHTRVHPSWGRTEGGSAGAGFGLPSFTATSHQYSIKMRMESDARAPYDPDTSGSMTSYVSLDYAWKGEVW